MLALLTDYSCHAPHQIIDPTDTKHPPVATDTDGDGIADKLDMEPYTPIGCPVDGQGRALDSDGDGYIDCMDAEVHSPIGYKVDNKGVAIVDRDGDGVNDGEDKCPDVPGSLENKGCPSFGSAGSGSGGGGQGHQEPKDYSPAPNPPSKPPHHYEELPEAPPRTKAEPGDEGEDNESGFSLPKYKQNASIAYACANHVAVGQKIDMRVKVAMLSTEKETSEKLKKIMPNPVTQVATDTIVRKTLTTTGADSLRIELIYDTNYYKIVWKNMPAQALIYLPNVETDWHWEVTGLRPTGNNTIGIDFRVYAKNIGGKWEPRDTQAMYLKIQVDGWPWWYWGGIGVVALLVLAGGLVFYLMRKKMTGGSTKSKSIYFSYAWNQQEQLVDQLYDSLLKDGFQVVRDKKDLGYRGTISDFMSEIGNANYVIIAISDKYLKSRFCMFELLEIYRNSGMDKAKFVERIFPIRVENINLSDTDVVNGYVNYWETEEARWDKNMKDNSDNVTPEQTKQYQVVKRLVNELTALLQILSDINALNLDQLQKDDFKEVKAALRKELEKNTLLGELVMAAHK